MTERQSHAIGHESNQLHLLIELQWVGGQWSVQWWKRRGGGRTNSPATCHHLESSEPVIRSQNLEQQDYSISISVYLVSGDGNAIRPTGPMQQLQSSWGAWQPTAVVLAFCHQAHRGWHARIHGMLCDTRVTIQNTVAVERLTELTLARHEWAKNDKGTSNQDSPPLIPNLHQINPVHCVPRVQCSSCTFLI